MNQTDEQPEESHQGLKILAGLLGLALLLLALGTILREPSAPTVALPHYRLEMSGGQGPGAGVLGPTSSLGLCVRPMKPIDSEPDVMFFVIGVDRFGPCTHAPRVMRDGSVCVEGRPADLSLPRGTSTVAVVIAPPGGLPSLELLERVLTGATHESLAPAQVLISPDIVVGP